MKSNVELMIPPPKKWIPDHYQFTEKQMVPTVSLNAIEYSIEDFSTHITEIARNIYLEERRLMNVGTDEEWFSIPM